MLCAILSIHDVPNVWYHEKTLKNKNGFTVEDIYLHKNLDVPLYWRIKTL